MLRDHQRAGVVLVVLLRRLDQEGKVRLQRLRELLDQRAHELLARRGGDAQADVLERLLGALPFRHVADQRHVILLVVRLHLAQRDLDRERIVILPMAHRHHRPASQRRHVVHEEPLRDDLR